MSIEDKGKRRGRGGIDLAYVYHYIENIAHILVLL